MVAISLSDAQSYGYLRTCCKAADVHPCTLFGTRSSKLVAVNTIMVTFTYKMPRCGHHHYSRRSPVLGCYWPCPDRIATLTEKIQHVWPIWINDDGQYM